MTGTQRVYGAIATAAAIASFSASVGFARAHGADAWHVFAIPFCLEALALAAVWDYLSRRDRTSLVVFGCAFAAALWINVAHGAPDPVLMALYAIPPLTVVGAGHMFLRTLPTQSRSEPTHVKTDAHSSRRREVVAHTNGHKPTLAKPTAEQLRDMTTAELEATRDRYGGTWAAMCRQLDVTPRQVEYARRKAAA